MSRLVMGWTLILSQYCPEVLSVTRLGAPEPTKCFSPASSVRLMNEFTNMPVPPKPRQGESRQSQGLGLVGLGSGICISLQTNLQLCTFFLFPQFSGTGS